MMHEMWPELGAAFAAGAVTGGAAVAGYWRTRPAGTSPDAETSATAEAGTGVGPETDTGAEDEDQGAGEIPSPFPEDHDGGGAVATPAVPVATATPAAESLREVRTRSLPEAAPAGADPYADITRESPTPERPVIYGAGAVPLPYGPTSAGVARVLVWAPPLGLAPHHPHYVSASGTGYVGGIRWQFRQFTGTEPDPMLWVPEGWVTPMIRTMGYDRWRVYEREVSIAALLWEAARRERAMVAAIRAAAPAGAAYVAARERAVSAWEAVTTAPDNRYRSAVAALLSAHRELTEAAPPLDRCGRPILDAQDPPDQGWREDVRDEMRTIEELAASVGVDATGWELGYEAREYSRPPWSGRDWLPPAAEAARKLITEHRDQLAEIASVFGDDQDQDDDRGRVPEPRGSGWSDLSDL
ncbi:hypothetical protein SAMN05421803_14913 [Nocardiopsis flavescens]|uniref:Uncharacterized protein n=2 Tax=Nocardiopsis flavescens TaxID=758803 RepID=A0A1M6WRJ3_9ACTN|nr:hypothetical protein SAMN05421803_14913 [Nocardiopsis flavescens]